MTDTPKPLKGWALNVYFAADVPEAQARAWAIRNLVDIAYVGSNQHVYVTAQINLPRGVTRRYVLPEVPSANDSLAIAPAVSGSLELRSITEFLKWSAAACPAHNTIIVLCGHGYGIDDFMPRELQPSTGRQGVEALEMVAPRTRPLSVGDFKAWLPGLPLEPLSDEVMRFLSLLPDDTVGTNPTNAQVARSIRAAFPALAAVSKKPAILGLASCNMAMAEAWSELAECAEIGLASQTAVPYRDWPLGPILKRLHANPADPKAAAAMIQKTIIDSYACDQDDYLEISTLQLSLTGKLQEAVKSLAGALTNEVSKPGSVVNILEARNYSPIYDPDGFLDLGCFCHFLKITLPMPDVIHACNKTIEALGQLVLSWDYSPKGRDIKLMQSNGMSIWFPSWIQFPKIRMMERERSIAYLRSGYPESRFALSTGWDKFLVAIRDAAEELRRRSALVVPLPRSG